MNKTWKGPRHGGWQRAHARASGAAVYVAGHLPSGSRHPVCHEQRPGEPRETAPKTNPDPVVPAAGFAHSPEEARGHGQEQPLLCSSRPRSLLRTRAAAAPTPHARVLPGSLRPLCFLPPPGTRAAAAASSPASPSSPSPAPCTLGWPPVAGGRNGVTPRPAAPASGQPRRRGGTDGQPRRFLPLDFIGSTEAFNAFQQARWKLRQGRAS